MPVALVEGPSVLWRVGRHPGVFEWRLPKDREMLASDERPHLASAGAAQGSLFIDMASPQTHNLLGERLPHLLRYLGVHQFDRGVVMSQDRRVTRQIAGFLREYADSDLHEERPIAGLRYESRIAAEQTCWAIWQDRLQLSDEQVSSIASEDPDLLKAAELLDLEVAAAKTLSSSGE